MGGAYNVVASGNLRVDHRSDPRSLESSLLFIDI
jgi:hypothetical protein